MPPRSSVPKVERTRAVANGAERRNDNAYGKMNREAKNSILAMMLALSFAKGLPSVPRQTSDGIEKVQALIQQRDLASAQSLLSQLLKESASDPNLYNLQGVVLAQEEDFAGSEASFKRAIELAPQLEQAYLNLGHLYQERIRKDEGARDKAIGIYTQLLKVDPGSLEASYQAALLLMQKGLYKDSLNHLGRMPGSAQARSQALSVLCGDDAGLGDAQKAKDAAARMIQSPDLAEADVRAILPVLVKHPNPSLAIQCLDGLAKRHLASFASLDELGLLYEQQGRHDDARQALEQAAQLQPASVPLLLELAKVANQQKDYTGALGYLAHARDLDPSDAAIHFLWGVVCVEEGLSQEAYQAFKKAVSLDPQNAEFNYALGRVELQRTDASEAIPHLQKYCELKPHDSRGPLALGIAYYDRSDFEKSAQILSKLVRDPLTTDVAYYYLGRIATREGDYARAKEDLLLAIKTNANYPDAYAELGLVRLKQKEYPQAEEAFQRALKLNPDNYTANLNLLILYQRTNNPKAPEQQERFNRVNAARAQREKDSLRSIEVRP
jgi:tetratricopeptide (TPR) repeat protein